jgi:hypothetical protein
MRSPIRTAVPLALAAGIVAVAPAAAQKPAPSAHAAGGGAPLVIAYPSIVQTRVGRARRALRRAVNETESDSPSAAVQVASLKVVRRQMAAAWRGAKYVIRTTPPPVATDAGVHAHKSQSVLDVTGTPASAADTGLLVLMLQHHVAATMLQLIDGAHGTGLNAISSTLNFTLNRRDAAIQDIFQLSPPAPPAADARVHAHASGGLPVATTFDTQMPLYVGFLTDETQAVDGLKSEATDLTNGGRRLLNDAQTQILRTRGFVNATWPPIPVDA